jgi:cell division protein FtsN
MAATQQTASGNAAELAKAAATAIPAPQADTATPQPALADASTAPAAAKIAALDVPPAAPAPEPAPVVQQQVVSHPVVQPVREVRKVPAQASVAAHGSHVVQLGSFSSADGAQRASRHFIARNRGLAGFRSQITQVAVNGRQFWRVQAVGFSGFASARQMCQSVKAKGGVCLVMADPATVSPQGRPTLTRMAQR